MSIKFDQLRLRVFAGPNGSGKSSVIEKIREYKVKGRPIDFGIYINADEIARQLAKAPLSLNSYEVKTTNKEFRRVALESGLIGDRFHLDVFDKSYSLRSNRIRLKDTKSLTPLAQIVADFLRRKLLAAEKKFSFETVFSHESKLDIMRDAMNAGYKVYLYFVCTDSPDINVSPVQSRVQAGGHDVPEDKIRSRYFPVA